MIQVNKLLFTALCLLLVVTSFASGMFAGLLWHSSHASCTQNQTYEKLIGELQFKLKIPRIVHVPGGCVFAFDASAYANPKNVQLYVWGDGDSFPFIPYQNSDWSLSFFVPTDQMRKNYGLVIGDKQGKQGAIKPRPDDLEL